MPEPYDPASWTPEKHSAALDALTAMNRTIADAGFNGHEAVYVIGQLHVAALLQLAGVPGDLPASEPPIAGLLDAMHRAAKEHLACAGYPKRSQGEG